MAALTERQKVEIEIYAKYNPIDGVSRPINEPEPQEQELSPEERMKMIARSLGAKVK
jgi:hypothetical protein